FSCFIFTLRSHPPRPTLFPYTTLFRSARIGGSNTSDARGTVVVRTDRPTITLRHVRGFANAPPVHWQIIINRGTPPWRARDRQRSEEHTSELQSRSDLVCRLLLEKKKE